MSCRRINVFIGEPNTGKSNLLEALGLLSHFYYTSSQDRKLRNFVRMEDLTNLFYDRDITKQISISLNEKKYNVKHEENGFSVIEFEKRIGSYQMDGEYSPEGSRPVYLSALKFYRFAEDARLTGKGHPHLLLPPHGSNLIEVLVSSTPLRKLAGMIFSRFGLKLVVNPKEERIELQKEEEGIAVSYPYTTISETLRRLLFYISAIKTAQDSVLALEEPESHAFPFYTRYLGELIVSDSSNQYFIATHNPYFLMAIVEKAPKGDVAVYLTYYEDHQTKVRKLEQQKILDIGFDIFFDLDKFLPKQRSVANAVR